MCCLNSAFLRKFENLKVKGSRGSHWRFAVESVQCGQRAVGHIVLHTWLQICRRLSVFPVCWQGEEMVVSWCRLFGTPTLRPVSDILCYIKLGFQSGVANAIHICKGNAFSFQMCHLKGRHSNGISGVFFWFFLLRSIVTTKK